MYEKETEGDFGPQSLLRRYLYQRHKYSDLFGSELYQDVLQDATS